MTSREVGRRWALLSFVLFLLVGVAFFLFQREREVPDRSGERPGIVMDEQRASEGLATDADERGRANRVVAGEGTSNSSVAIQLAIDGEPISAPLRVRVVAPAPTGSQEGMTDRGQVRFDLVEFGQLRVEIETPQGTRVADHEAIVDAGTHEIVLSLSKYRELEVHVVVGVIDPIPRISDVAAQVVVPALLAWNSDLELITESALDQDQIATASISTAISCDELGHRYCGVCKTESDRPSTVALVLGSFVVARVSVPAFERESTLTVSRSLSDYYSGTLRGRFVFDGHDAGADSLPDGGIAILASKKGGAYFRRELDAQGSLEISGLLPGDLRLIADFIGYEKKFYDVTMPVSGNVDLGTLFLSQGRHVIGRVIDEQTHPVVVTVRATPEGTERHLIDESWWSSDGGRLGAASVRPFALFQLPPAVIAVQIDDPRFAVNPTMFDVTNGCLQDAVLLVQEGVEVRWVRSEAMPGSTRVQVSLPDGTAIYEGSVAVPVRLLPGRYYYAVGTQRNDRTPFTVSSGEPHLAVRIE